jgi:ribosomal protein L7/L12
MADYDFNKYLDLRQKGLSAADVYRAAVADGVGEIARLRLLREIFDLSLVEAKRIVAAASKQAKPLEAQQEDLLHGLEKALRKFEDLD